MVAPVSAIDAVNTILEDVPVGFATYQISELLPTKDVVARMALTIEMPPIVTAVSSDDPAELQFILTTEIRLALAPPVPCAVNVMVVPGVDIHPLLMGVPVGPPLGAQKP